MRAAESGRQGSGASSGASGASGGASGASSGASGASSGASGASSGASGTTLFLAVASVSALLLLLNPDQDADGK